MARRKLVVNQADNFLNNIVNFTLVQADKATTKAGVKAVSSYHMRQSLIKQAQQHDAKAGNKLVLVSQKAVQTFITDWAGFDLSNIGEGKSMKTALGHKYFSKAGSCDLLVFFSLYPNITTQQLIDMLVNHVGCYTKQATVKALYEKVKAHSRQKPTTGSHYFTSNMFISRLSKAGQIPAVNSTMRQSLATLSNEVAEAILPKLKIQAKAEADKAAKAKAKAEAEAKAKAEAKAQLQPASQPKADK